jgi:hypothetical protein
MSNLGLGAESKLITTCAWHLEITEASNGFVVRAWDSANPGMACTEDLRVATTFEELQSAVVQIITASRMSRK